MEQHTNNDKHETRQQDTPHGPSAAGNSSEQDLQQGSHHHHHHRSSRRRSYEEHLRRAKEKERRERIRKIKSAAMVTLIGVAAVVLGTALLAPQLFSRLGSTPKDVGNGVVASQTADRQLKLDYDGIDVSHHQGVINWERVSYDTCVKYVYIKATEGSSIVDRNYQQNAEGAQKVGLNFGSYHYLTSKSSVIDQFRNFYSVVDKRKQKVIPMINIEEEGVQGWNRTQIQDSLALMIRLIRKYYAATPIIYSSARFYNENLAPRFNDYQLFLARYNAKQPVAAGAGRRNVWQHTDQGIVDGIDTPVNLSIMPRGTTLHDLLMEQPH